MTLPPNIPTSFVPHVASRQREFNAGLIGAFGFFSYTVLGIVFLLALAVFLYGRILVAEKDSTDKTLLAAEQSIDSNTVDDLVRLRDRLVSSKSLIDNHTVFSPFFSSLERILPSTVQFTTLDLSFDVTGSPRINGSGVAKSFNALAVASTAFAEDGRIKDAIFSNISIGKDNSVTFTLTANLDPKIIVFTP